jgi:hypothetical protein
MPRVFDDVCYATQKRMRALATLLLPYDHRGKLEVDQGMVRFSAGKHLIEMNVHLLSYARTRFPLGNLLVGNGLILLSMRAGLFTYFTWDNPESIVLLAGLNLFVLWAWWSRPWILLEYSDPDGNVQQAYFKDWSSFGWGDLLGGTKRMYKVIEAQLQLPEFRRSP